MRFEASKCDKLIQLLFIQEHVFMSIQMILTLPAPMPDEEKKKALKTLIKPFEAPQRSVKIKI